jgi:hypothetical protein
MQDCIDFKYHRQALVLASDMQKQLHKLRSNLEKNTIQTLGSEFAKAI